MYRKFISWLLILNAAAIFAYGQHRPIPQTDTFIVKFRSGYPVRLNKTGPAPQLYLNHKYLPLNDAGGRTAQTSLNQFAYTLEGYAVNSIEKLFPKADTVYDQQRADFEQKKPFLVQDFSIGPATSVPDLNSYYKIVVPVKPGFVAADFLTALEKNPAVETAYPMYHTENAGIIGIHPLVIHSRFHAQDADYTSTQSYLYDRPRGISAPTAWAIPGGKGDGVRIVDIEFSWNTQHSDLKPNTSLQGACDENKDYDAAHGTAVLGELVGVHNDFGVNGICPNSTYGLVSVGSVCTVSAAISLAADTLSRGDIILIEQQLKPDHPVQIIPGCPYQSPGDLPVDSISDIYSAILLATGKGIIVVEAAGNGMQNLDDPKFQGKFDPTHTDGAIMVAADGGGDGNPTCFTNYGHRINYFAWGMDVVTTGFGDLSQLASDPNHFYTNSFSGTSSASPIIAGIIADIQGIRLSKGLPPWNTGDFLRHLRGTRQAAGTENKPIGIFPNLQATLENP